METTSTTPQQRVLDAACELFIENGYQVGMEAVARRAGVAKQTVYAHFSSKDDLFRAAARAVMAPLHASMEPPREDIGDCLRFVAKRYIAYVSDPRMVGLGRLLMAQASRFPRMAQAMCNTGPESTIKRVAARLAKAMDNGQLRRDDPDAAAELFLAMLDGIESHRRLLGAPVREPLAQDAWVRHVVDTFLRAYAPTPSPTHSEPRIPA